MDDQNSINTIRSIIETLIFEGGEDNFCTITLGEYYIQLACSKGSLEIYCEAVSNYYLEDPLTEDQKDTLIQLNWDDSVIENGNYFRSHPIDSESSREELAHLLFQTAKQVYHCATINLNQITLNLA
ncbi:MAG: hypothetical protein P1U56_10475 [Saprospiraceae bacterium]|nr:hypothetical protein [Saprospiraceae bacterium]